MSLRKNDTGFTLVELMLAMASFSFVLLFITVGFIMVNRSYNKGITVKLIQDEGRQLMEELTREIRITSSLETTADCVSINNAIYHWSEPENPPPADPALSPKILIKEIGNKTCTSPREVDTSVDGVQRVLDERVGVQYMNVEQLRGSSYKISITLSTIEMDLITSAGEDASCSVSTGGEYCDVVKFTTVVSTR